MQSFWARIFNILFSYLHSCKNNEDSRKLSDVFISFNKTCFMIFFIVFKNSINSFSEQNISLTREENYLCILPVHRPLMDENSELCLYHRFPLCDLFEANDWRIKIIISLSCENNLRTGEAENLLFDLLVSSWLTGECNLQEKNNISFLLLILFIITHLFNQVLIVLFVSVVPLACVSSLLLFLLIKVFLFLILTLFIKTLSLPLINVHNIPDLE